MTSPKFVSVYRGGSISLFIPQTQEWMTDRKADMVSLITMIRKNKL